MRKRNLALILACGSCLCAATWLLIVPDTVPEKFVKGHEQLRADSAAVEGEFVIYRIDKAMWDAFTKPPEELGIPLQNAGYVWREPGRFRFDITEGEKGAGYLVAAEGNTLFEMRVPPAMSMGVLREIPRRIDLAKKIERFYAHNLSAPIDSLWADEQRTLVGIAKDRNTELESTAAGGYLLQPDDSTNSGVERVFAAGNLHPLQWKLSQTDAAGRPIKRETRVESREIDGRWLPAKIVTVCESKHASYTEVVVLRLKPLSNTSPIAGAITPDTFHNRHAKFVSVVVGGRKGLLE